MNLPDEEGVAALVRELLRDGLPSNLLYHDLDRTVELTVPAADRFAAAMGVDARTAVLARTAAWLHDVGFVERYDEPEELSVAKAREVLPGFGYSPDDVDAVTGAIRATRAPRRPTSLLEEIVCDADLDVLGHPRFPDRDEALRIELAAHGRHFSDVNWYRSRLALFATHRWFTPAARDLDDAGKLANATELARRLRAAEGAQ